MADKNIMTGVLYAKELDENNNIIGRVPMMPKTLSDCVIYTSRDSNNNYYTLNEIINNLNNKIDSIQADITAAITGDYVTNTTFNNTITNLNTVINGKAASSHTHSTNDITSGTLSVARGGTGATTFTSNQVLIGNGTNAIGTRPIDTNAGGTANSTSLITSGAVNSSISTINTTLNNLSTTYLTLNGNTNYNKMFINDHKIQFEKNNITFNENIASTFDSSIINGYIEFGPKFTELNNYLKTPNSFGIAFKYLVDNSTRGWSARYLYTPYCTLEAISTHMLGSDSIMVENGYYAESFFTYAGLFPLSYISSIPEDASEGRMKSQQSMRLYAKGTYTPDNSPSLNNNMAAYSTDKKNSIVSGYGLKERYSARTGQIINSLGISPSIIPGRAWDEAHIMRIATDIITGCTINQASIGINNGESYIGLQAHLIPASSGKYAHTIYGKDDNGDYVVYRDATSFSEDTEVSKYIYSGASIGVENIPFPYIYGTNVYGTNVYANNISVNKDTKWYDVKSSFYSNVIFVDNTSVSGLFNNQVYCRVYNNVFYFKLQLNILQISSLSNINDSYKRLHDNYICIGRFYNFYWGPQNISDYSFRIFGYNKSYDGTDRGDLISIRVYIIGSSSTLSDNSGDANSTNETYELWVPISDLNDSGNSVTSIYNANALVSFPVEKVLGNLVS